MIAEISGVFAGSMAAGTLSTWLTRCTARWTGILSRPNPIVPQHTRPVAYLGGIGIGIGLLLVMFVIQARIPLRILLPAGMMLLLGTVDDIYPLSPLGKFLPQVMITAVAFLMGFRASFTGTPAIDCLLSAFFILVLINAFNLTDVTDGLLPVLTITACIGLAFLGANLPLTVTVAGVTAGFLIWNRPDASIFLGDGGSHLLGFLVGVLILDPSYGALSFSVHLWHLMAAMLCVALPLFELLFLVVARTRKGIPWYKGSPDHYSLRLQSNRVSKWGVLGISVGMSLVMCALGQLLILNETFIRFPILVLAVAGFLTFGSLLMKLEPQRDR